MKCRPVDAFFTPTPWEDTKMHNRERHALHLRDPFRSGRVLTQLTLPLLCTAIRHIINENSLGSGGHVQSLTVACSLNGS